MCRGHCSTLQRDYQLGNLFGVYMNRTDGSLGVLVTWIDVRPCVSQQLTAIPRRVLQMCRKRIIIKTRPDTMDGPCFRTIYGIEISPSCSISCAVRSWPFAYTIYVSRAKCTKHVMGRKGRSVCPTCRRSENAYNNEVYSCNKEMLMILYMIRW